MASPGTAPSYGWLSAFITLIVVWSVLARKRWARLALVGISLVTLSGFLEAYNQPSASHSILADGIVRLLPNYDLVLHDALYRETAALLSLGTIFWFLLGPVRDEFERFKRLHTKAAQPVIACFLLCVWCFCQWESAPISQGNITGQHQVWAIQNTGNSDGSDEPTEEDDLT